MNAKGVRLEQTSQVLRMKTIEREPLMTCRNLEMRSKAVSSSRSESVRAEPGESCVDGPNDLRHIGGVSIRRAVIRNVGTSIWMLSLGQGETEKRQVGILPRARTYGCQMRGAEHFVVARKPSNVGGAKGVRSGARDIGSTQHSPRGEWLRRSL